MKSPCRLFFLLPVMRITTGKKHVGKFQAFGTMRCKQVNRVFASIHFHHRQGYFFFLHEIKMGYEILEKECWLTPGFFLDKIKKSSECFQYFSFVRILHGE